MNKRPTIRDELLRADGIDPAGVSNPELEWFRGALAEKPAARSLRQRVVTRRIGRWAAVAAVLVLAVAGVYFFAGGSSRVWAKVLDNVRKTDNYQYHETNETTTVTATGEENVLRGEGIAYLSDDEGVVQERHSEGQVSARIYYLFDRQERVTIVYADKECRRSPQQAPDRDDFRNSDPRQLVIRALEGEYTELGCKTVDGRVLAGIESHDATVVLGRHAGHHEAFTLRFWIDMETKLPVRMETEYTRRTDMWTRTSKGVMDQFQWNLEFPADFFTPQIPEGFTVWTDRPDEIACIDSLRLLAERTGGKYLPRLDRRTFWDAMNVRELPPSASDGRQMASGEYHHDSIFDAVAFFDALVEQGHDVGYYGDTVTPTDANSVLMYWDLSETERRVIWGDLRVETMSVTQLARHCRDARQIAPLVDLLPNAPRDVQSVIAGYLGAIADERAIVVLQKCSEQWGGPADENPFERAIDAIWRRTRDGDSQAAVALLVRGRLMYANGRPVNRGTVRLEQATCRADEAGYFTMAAPAGGADEYHLGRAYDFRGRTSGVFFWSPAQAEKSSNVVLDFPCTVRVRVVDTHGTLLRDATIKLISHPEEVTDDFWMLPNRAKIDAEGYFIFRDVPVGLPLELFVRVSNIPGTEIRIPIGDVLGDRTYTLADVVLDTASPEKLKQIP